LINYNKNNGVNHFFTPIQQKSLSERSKEIFPLGLTPFSSQEDIKQKCHQISESLGASVSRAELDNQWKFICKQLHSSAILPYKKNIYKRLKRLLTQAVKRSGFIFQSIIGDENGKYISSNYYEHLLELKPNYSNSDTYVQYLFSKVDNTKLFARACQQFTRACGISSLAQKDGLTAHLLTITLKSDFHRSAKEWNGITPDQAALMISTRWTKLQEYLRNNSVKYEMFRNIDPHDDGTPHLHATIFTDDADKFKSMLLRAFSDISKSDNRGIRFEETNNPYRALLYTLKTIWPTSDKVGERQRVWKQQLSARCLSFSSSMRKLPSVGYWEMFRRDRFETEKEIKLLGQLKSKIKYDLIERLDGELFFRLDNYTEHLDSDDAVSHVFSDLEESASDGDFAQFTRVFNMATRTRKYHPTRNVIGIKTSGSLGSIEIAEITKLRTIRQVLHKFGDKIRDIKDYLWILRNKQYRKKSPEQIRLDKKRTDFLRQFKKTNQKNKNDDSRKRKSKLNHIIISSSALI